MVFRFRSVRSIVIPPASTGRDSRSRIVVIKTPQTKSGICSDRNPLVRMLITVVIKLSEPKMDEIPARWREKMAKSTDGPA